MNDVLACVGVIMISLGLFIMIKALHLNEEGR